MLKLGHMEGLRAGQCGHAVEHTHSPDFHPVSAKRTAVRTVGDAAVLSLPVAACPLPFIVAPTPVARHPEMRGAWCHGNLLNDYRRHRTRGALVPVSWLPLPSVLAPGPMPLYPGISRCWWWRNHFLDGDRRLAHNRWVIVYNNSLLDDGSATAQGNCDGSRAHCLFGHFLFPCFL